MRMCRLLHAGITAVLIGGTSVAEAEVKAADFDFNGNGQIDPGPEAEAFLKHVNKQLKAYREIDTTKDGKISDKERDAYEQRANEAIAQDLVDFNDLRGQRSGVPLAEAQRVWRLDPEPDPLSLYGLLIRRSADDVPATEAIDSKRFKDASAARFSFVRDFEGEESVWEAHAALLYPLRLSGRPEGPRSVSVLLVPSISLDRISSDKKKKEVNSLVFRLGSELEAPGFVPGMELQYFRAGLAYATDTRFRSEVGAIELEWEPVILRAGMHSRRRIGDLFEYRARALVAAQGGRTFEAGDKENLESGNDFFRIGPKLELRVWPRMVERLSARLSWQYMTGVVGEPKRTYLLEAGLAFQLDARGHFSLELGYQKGRIPLTEEDTEAVNVGIGVKF